MSQGELPIADAQTLGLLRLAVSLGAREFGGPLSAAEKSWLKRTKKLPPPAATVQNQAKAAIRAGRDPLGDELCAIRSPKERRAVGAFYTQPALLEPMVRWAMDHAPKRIVDPGCGSGRFAGAVIREKRDLDVVAIDIDPVAALLCRATLASLGAKNAKVICGDYTDLTLPVVKGVTAYIGNPPYVRHHELSPVAKQWAQVMADKLGHRASALAGLHAHFYLMTAALARKGDVGCFVTSAEWLDVNWGSIVRGLLTDRLGGTHLHVLDPKAVAFSDAMTTAAIACFEVGSEPASLKVRRVASTKQLGDLTRGRAVKRKRLAEATRWSPLLSRGSTKAPKNSMALGDVARVHRGVVTGGNDFFVMTQAQAEELGIAQWCRPAITSAKEIISAPGIVRASANTKVILDLDESVDIDRHPALAKHLRRGVRDGISKRYVPSHRKPWWRVGISQVPPIVVSYMARQAPVFALNPDGMALLNIAHGIYPRENLSRRQLKALVATLNQSRNSYRGSGRTYHGGLEKFEPREMEALPIPRDCL